MFPSHDRAKVASDTDLDHARKLLAHADGRITQRVYRRKAETVEAGSFNSTGKEI
jgi:hypothetical protein